MGKSYINPYNFVPFGGEVERKAHNAHKSGEALHTGEINCTMEIVTPLAIPDATEVRLVYTNEEGKPPKKEHKTYPFMTIDKVPVVPGSEIRGAIRNIYETVTNSCFSVINSNVLSHRSSDTKAKAGLLQWDDSAGRWRLFEATKYSYFTKSAIEAAQEKFKEKGIDYVGRYWNIFKSLCDTWENMKSIVNEAISHSDDYDNSFLDYIESKGLIEPAAYEDGCSADDSIVLCFKKDRDKYLSGEMSKTVYETKLVDLEKKWGPQYSYDEIVKHFGQDISKNKLYNEPIIGYSAFVKGKEKTDCVIQADSFGNYPVIEKYNGLLDLYIFYTPSNKTRYEAVRPQKDGKLYPLFYRGSGGSIQFTPAQISRVSFDNTVENLLDKDDKSKDKSYGHSPCRMKDKLCPACRLFGMVGKGGNAVASRVRFTDAEGCQDVKLFPESYNPERCLTLKELSSPKLTSIEFYSIKSKLDQFTDIENWTYDNIGVTLRGRKMYLHDPKAVFRPDGENSFSVSEKTKRNSSMQLAVSGSFSFKVYFDRITDTELKYLLWSLTLGDSDGSSSLSHKLGHGKPLGLGSVKISIDEGGIKERVFSGDSYSITEGNDASEYLDSLTVPIEGTDTLTALKTICDFNYISGLNSSESIAYPIGTKGSGNRNTDNNTMMWFSLNHGGIGRNSRYQYVLHPLVDPDGKSASCRSLLLSHLPVVTPSEAAPQKGNPQNTRNSTPPQESLKLNEIYTAQITGSHTSKNGEIYIDITVNGTTMNFNARYLPKGFPENIEALKKRTVKVKYLGKKNNYHQVFVDKNQ